MFLSLAHSVSGATIVVNDQSSAYHGSGCGVTGTGLCSLVDAIAFANVHPGSDAIHFNIPGGGTRTILPSAPVPALTDDAGVTIDGFTQPGASPNTLPVGNNTVWRVRLSAASVMTPGSGILIQSDNNVVRGLMLEKWSDGVRITSASGNQIGGNLLGSEPEGGGNGFGVFLEAGASANRVGGTTPADRNVMSRNSYGIYVTDVGTSNNLIQGNLIGLTSSGAVGQNSRGITIVNGSNSNVVGGTLPGAGNVISGNELIGIEMAFSSGNRIEGNFIGTTADGLAAPPTFFYAQYQGGVAISSESHDNAIGGNQPGAGNLISGNGQAVLMNGFNVTGNRVEGNRIGTNAAGTAAIPNGRGVGIGFNARGNIVGGTSPAQRNIISGNDGEGVLLDGSCTENAVIGNFIGVDISGSAPLGNGRVGTIETSGILIAPSAFRNRIGGVLPGEGNVIAYNGGSILPGAGVRVLPGAGSGDSFSNSILSNSIHSNTGLGIDLENIGPEPNDAGDEDAGANARQNYAVISAVSPSNGVTRVQGTLDSTPSTTFTVQFFSNAQCDTNGFGEGQNLVGSATVPTNAAGHADFDVLLSSQVPPGYRVTATATDSDGNTSEFSACFPQASSFYTVTPCRVVDTRDPPGQYGGPALAAGSERSFRIAGLCGIPDGAQAVSFNVTVTQPTALGNLRLFPVETIRPSTSILNYRNGQTRANNVIGSLGGDGRVVVRCDQFTGTAHVIIDVNGYFH
jgi:hypothetical protein